MLLPETLKTDICQRIEDYNQISSFGVMCSGKISLVLGLRKNPFLRWPRFSFPKAGAGLTPEKIRGILPYLAVDFS